MSFALFLAKMCTSVLANSSALFLAKICTFLPSWMELSSHFPLPKRFRIFDRFAFFVLLLSNGVTGDRRWSTETNDRICGCTVLLLIEKWIKLTPKIIGNRKRDCAWGCARGISTTWETLQIEKHKLGRRSFRSPAWFVLFDLQIFSGSIVSIPRAQPHAQSLFYSNFFFSILFFLKFFYFQ